MRKGFWVDALYRAGLEKKPEKPAANVTKLDFLGFLFVYLRESDAFSVEIEVLFHIKERNLSEREYVRPET